MIQMIPCSLIFLIAISVNIALQTEECLIEGILSIIIWIGVRFIIYKRIFYRVH